MCAARGFSAPPLPRVRWYTDEDERAARVTVDAPRIPWATFVEKIFTPQPGEHVTIVGSTGKGKTELTRQILPLFPFTVLFATKAADTTVDRMVAEQGYKRFERWPRLPAREAPRRVIWPRTGKLREMTKIQRDVFEDAIDHIYAEGGRPKERPVGWCIAIDEIWWFTNMLKMELELRVLWQHARSAGITLVAATQRAAFVPTEAFSQPTHLFFFQVRDENNLGRIGDLQAGNKRMIRDLVYNLEPFQVLYVNNVTGQMVRTRTPIPV